MRPWSAFPRRWSERWHRIGSKGGSRELAKASFARGVGQDNVAGRAAITLPWSDGQSEGQIEKLKLVKRQMCGRGKIDLLQARLIGLMPR
jgi:transposase